MKPFLLAVLLLLAISRAQAGSLLGLNSDELQALQGQGALVVDVRTPAEWQKTGIIPGSIGLTYFDATGGYDPEAWLQQLRRRRQSPVQPVVLVCRSGHRSQTVGKMLAEQAGFATVYHLEKGIQAWNAENRKLVAP